MHHILLLSVRLSTSVVFYLLLVYVMIEEQRVQSCIEIFL